MKQWLSWRLLGQQFTRKIIGHVYGSHWCDESSNSTDPINPNALSSQTSRRFNFSTKSINYTHTTTNRSNNGGEIVQICHRRRWCFRCKYILYIHTFIYFSCSCDLQLQLRFCFTYLQIRLNFYFIFSIDFLFVLCDPYLNFWLYAC